MAESLQDQIARQQADRKREIMRLALVDAFREGMDRGDDQATIDSNLSRLKRILENQHQIPFSMADGGEATKDVGIGPLSPIARDMNRGPKGIARFAGGGEGIIRFPSKEKSEAIENARRFIERDVSIDDVPVKREGILARHIPEKAKMVREFGNLEYTADMQPFLDPIARYGFDPDEVNIDPRIINYDFPTSYRFNPMTGLDGDGPSITITGKHAADKSVQAHEFRERGLQMLLNDYTVNAPEYYQKYGAKKHKQIAQLLNEIKKDRDSFGGSKDYSQNVREMIAEFFETPEGYFEGARYQGQYNPERPESDEFASVDLNFKNPMNQRILNFDNSEMGQPLTKKELEEIISKTGLKIKKITQEYTPEIAMSRLETKNQPEFRAYLNTPVDEREPNEFFDSVIALSEHARDLNQQKRGFANGGEADATTEYRNSLFGTESFGGKLDAENKRTRALGASQAMPDTLEDFKKETDQSFSNDEYRNSADLQSQFQSWYENKTLQYIADNNLNEYIGTKVKGIPVTLSGMMAVAHLGGNYGMKRFLESDGRVDPSDNPDNPEQGTKLSDYLAKHSGLNVYGMQQISDVPITEGERLVMNQPFEAPAAKYSSEKYNNPAFFQRPLSRPFMPTEPMPRPRSRPLALPEGRSLIEKYGLPGTMPEGGILNLTNSVGPR